MSSKLSALVDLAGGQVPTDLAYIDDVSAGLAGSKRSTLNNLFEQITKNITDAVLKGIAGSGVNSPGENLGLSGGLGTGNADPGQVVVRYPLHGASGSTPQSLSANSYPVVTAQYTSTNTATIANTITETSAFTGLTSSAGSTRDIEAGISRAGTVYRVKMWGNISTTGTPTLQTRVKLNSTDIGNTGAAAMALNTNGRFWLEFEIRVTAIGAGGGVDCFPHLQYSVTGAGALTVNDIGGANVAAIDFTVAQTIDVTFTWSVASPSNSITIFGVTIERLR